MAASGADGAKDMVSRGIAGVKCSKVNRM